MKLRIRRAYSRKLFVATVVKTMRRTYVCIHVEPYVDHYTFGV